MLLLKCTLFLQLSAICLPCMHLPLREVSHAYTGCSFCCEQNWDSRSWGAFRAPFLYAPSCSSLQRRLPCMHMSVSEASVALRRLFFLLRTGPGTAVVGGPSMLLPKCPFMQPFAKMPVKQRETILQYWATGPLPLLRKVKPCSVPALS